MKLGGSGRDGNSCGETCDFYCSVNWRLENDEYGCPVWVYDVRQPKEGENAGCFHESMTRSPRDCCGRPNHRHGASNRQLAALPAPAARARRKLTRHYTVFLFDQVQLRAANRGLSARIHLSQRGARSA